jgi:hypothetical protein
LLVIFGSRKDNQTMQKGSGISFVVPDMNRTKDVLCARVVCVFLDMVYERLRIRATDYVLAAVF